MGYYIADRRFIFSCSKWCGQRVDGWIGRISEPDGLCLKRFVYNDGDFRSVITAWAVCFSKVVFVAS